MQDIRHTITEYEESHAKIQGRIRELNARISKHAKCPEYSSLNNLIERRGILYTQLWDLEYAIRELKDYIRAGNVSEVKQKVG